MSNETLARTALFDEVVNLKVSQSGDLVFAGALVRGRRAFRVLLDVIHFEDGFACKYNCYLGVGPVKWLFEWDSARTSAFDHQMILSLATCGIVPDANGCYPPLKVELREIWD